MPDTNQPNSAIFLDLFSEIEQELRKNETDRFNTGFTDMLRKQRLSNPVLKSFYTDLQEYAQLRNAIVHTRRENFIIAEPHDDVIKHIRRIRNVLMNPPRLHSVMTLNPYTSNPTDPIQKVLAAFAEKDIMRSPVLENGRIIGLITSKTLAQWMMHYKENVINLSYALVNDLMPFACSDDYVVVSENMDIYSLSGTFKNSVLKGKYVQAALVTTNGRTDSDLKGIITPGDLPYLLEKR